MTLPRSLRTALTAATLLSGMVLATRSEPSAADERRVTMGLFGDSFSSGEGLLFTDQQEQDCQRALGRPDPGGKASTAWGIQVRNDARDYPVDSWFAACTGATSLNYAGQAQVGAKRDKTQLEEARSGIGKPTFDIQMATFGGNDIGFSGVIYDCLGLDLLNGTNGGLGGTTFEAGGWLISGLAPGQTVARCRPDTNSTMRRKIEEVLRPALKELYKNMAGASKPGGLVIIASYPQLIETVADWSPLPGRTRRCHGIHVDDANMLNGVGGRLNQVIAEEVDTARRAHPTQTWAFVDITQRSFQRQHGLCGKEQPYLNGITPGLVGPQALRFARSFHPNEAGHKAYADSVRADTALQTWTPPKAVELPDFQNFTFPAGTCGNDTKAVKVIKGTGGDAQFDPPGIVSVKVHKGDLNGDGVVDALVQISCDLSGVRAGGRETGQVWSTASGKPEVIATVPVRTKSFGFDATRLDDLSISGRTVTVVEQVWGPQECGACSTTRATLRYTLEGSTFKLTGTPVISTIEPLQPAPAFIVGVLHGYGLAEVATEAVRKALPKELVGGRAEDLSCTLKGDITSECTGSIITKGGQTRQIHLAYSPDLPSDVEYVDGAYLRKGKPYEPTRSVVIDFSVS